MTSTARPYTADSAQVVDLGHTIWVLYIPDAEQAKDPRKVAENIIDRAYADVEVIATATRHYKSQGSTYSGWMIEDCDPIANKPAALAYLREHTIPSHFPAPEVRAAALAPQEQQQAPACLAPSGCSLAAVGTVRATRRDTGHGGVVGQYCSEHLAHPAATFPDAYTFEYLALDARGPIATEYLDAPATLATPQEAVSAPQSAQEQQDAPQAAPVAAAPQDAPQRPVTVHVDWTHREGERLGGIMLFSVTAAEEAATGRSPQFLITGGTRRKSVSAFSDYNGEDQFDTIGRLEDVITRAAAWLGLQGRELAVKVEHEWRMSR